MVTMIAMTAVVTRMEKSSIIVKIVAKHVYMYDADAKRHDV